MKNLSLFEKLFFVLNSIFSTLLIFSIFFAYVKPSLIQNFSLFTLLTPIFSFINLFFLFFWIISLKKQFLLSFVCLLISFKSMAKSFTISNSSPEFSENKLSILSYNVRMFNVYNWISDEDISNKISIFLSGQNPDIICLQEFYDKNFELKKYPYKFKFTRGDKTKYGQVIYSKHPIINKGEINFKSKSNSAIYADLKLKKDTIRIYNIHLESFSFDKSVDITQHNEKIISDISNTFITQQNQVEKIISNIKQCNYRYIITGDFNNTAHSYVYNKLITGLKDSFSEKGDGFGTTFSYKKIPFRIDYILIPKDYKVNNFKTYDVNFSDHKPIYSEFIY